ncbi:16S rRNA (guanine(966)-N(2))-methyltransferase RsmD [Paenibacillus tarimensis]
MGEEKPDEELMGKRKSSPRLSTTSLDADNLRITDYAGNIHAYKIIASAGFLFSSAVNCGTIASAVFVEGSGQAVRVIAGEAKGRPLKAVPGVNTRPTTDKVKEAMFSMIGPYFDGGAVLDLFAGTGGLGIEALSRGMERAVFIDLERQSIDVIRRNLEAARMEDRAEVYRNDASRAIKLLQKRELKFRLVFLDPPYKIKEADALMLELAERGVLEREAVIVVEHESGYRYPERFGDFTQTKQSRYGETTLTVYDYKTNHTETGGTTDES